MKIKGNLHQIFAAALIKKLNAHAKCKRIIKRSLHSLSVRREARFRCKNLSDTSTTIECSQNITSDLEFPELTEDGLVPQQQWDELFESAFEAIGDTCVEAFDEQ